MLEITIKGEAKEIAALAAAMQERREQRWLREKLHEAGIDPFRVESGICQAGSDAPGPVVTAEC